MRMISLGLGALLVGACSNDPVAPVSAKPPLVVAGNANACALRADSVAVCWGATTKPPAPWIVSTTLKFVAVTSATRFGCGLTAAGAAYCWGINDRGQLGDGTNTSSSDPVAVTGSHSFSAIASGGDHSCALDRSGTAWCWGANEFGQLGIAGAGTVVASTSTPAAVSGSFAQISAGSSHTCATDVDGLAWCWGHNAAGQLGDGTLFDHSSPARVTGSTRFASLSAGFFVTCGVATSHAAFCWGGLAPNMIGNGQSGGVKTPSPVSGGIAFASVSAAGAHVCGLALDGAAWCWGNNGFGQLGVDGGTPHSLPIRAAGSLRFTSLSAGPYDYSDETHNSGTSGHTCGVTTSGAVYCWGDNITGQLGAPTPTQSSAPVLVKIP